MATREEQLDQAIDTAFDELKSQYGKQKNDYYGLIYLENVLGLARPDALNCVTFGGHDFGIDGAWFNADDKQFRIFQFKNSKSAASFKGSLERLARDGIKALFESSTPVPDHQPGVDNVRRALGAARADIETVFLDFVFRGDPEEVERSQAMRALKEQIIEDYSYLLEDYFGRNDVRLDVRFISFSELRSRQIGDKFVVRVGESLSIEGPDNVQMRIGLVPLADLYAIFDALGRRFLERNIRFSLPEEGSVNRVVLRAMREIAQGSRPASAFAFNHNGITISAKRLDAADGSWTLRAPRLLNGAQTVSTFRAMQERHGAALRSAGDRIDAMKVLCRVIIGAPPEFVTEVTINNNRQNPVEPWLLHANDPIQLELADVFKKIGIYYQRQGNAYSSILAPEREEEGYIETRPIELVKLARTFLAAEGNLTRLARIREVFEEDRLYKEVFGHHRLEVNPQSIVLCYKIQFRLNKIINQIVETGANKYGFVTRTRDVVWALLCQAVLNEDDREDLEDRFGNNLATPAEWVDRLSKLATTRVRFLIKHVVEMNEYVSKVKDGNYSFLRTSAAFEKAMDRARKEYKWSMVRLGRPPTAG